MKKRIVGLFFIVFAQSAISLFAQGNTSIVLENSIQAIGGRKEIAKIRNIQAFADCVGPNGKYRTEIYSAVNSRLIFKQIRANGGTYIGQTNGLTYWTKDEKSGDLSVADKKEAFVWRSHDFQFLVTEIAERIRNLALAGDEEFNGKAAIRLLGTDEIGNAADLFFDKETKLMLGFRVQHPFGEPSDTIRLVFNEWKQVGKLKLPSKITATDKSGDFVLNFSEISLNKTDERIFAVPAQLVATRELLELHRRDRIAHFSRDAKMLVSGFADDFTEIGDGKIRKPTRETSLNRFQSYLSNTTFLEWDDITPPVIKVSDDATMAYILVHKKVRAISKDETGKEAEVTETFAWISVYRKIKGEWKLTAIASTNTPEKD